MKKMIKCPHCYGTGKEPDAYDLTNKPDPPCHVCNGTGEIILSKPNTQN